jgi:hypothetical protein
LAIGRKHERAKTVRQSSFNDSRIAANASATVTIQNELTGETAYIGKPQYKKHGATPIKLQAHGDPSPPISFRNIWIREL